MNEKQLEQLASDVDAIKRLIVFALLNQGHSQAKVAEAMGISQASVSRLLTKKSDQSKKE